MLANGMKEKIDDSDDLILDLLAKDDVLAATLLYKRYHLPIFNYINGIIEDSEASKDLVQELFVAIWEKRHSLNFTRPLAKYLFVAARHKAVNYLRDSDRTKLILKEVVARSGMEGDSLSADSSMETDQLADLIKRSLSLLPFKARRAFIMSRKYGMTYSEIAKQLLVTDKAVEKNMSKALALLRRFLADYLKVLLVM